VLTLTAMVGWLIVVHDLWERPAGGLSGRQARLFNTATVLTLGVGAMCFYVALFALNLGAEAFLLDNGVVEDAVGHPVGFDE